MGSKRGKKAPGASEDEDDVHDLMSLDSDSDEPSEYEEERPKKKAKGRQTPVPKPPSKPKTPGRSKTPATGRTPNAKTPARMPGKNRKEVKFAGGGKPKSAMKGGGSRTPKKGGEGKTKKRDPAGDALAAFETWIVTKEDALDGLGGDFDSRKEQINTVLDAIEAAVGDSQDQERIEGCFRTGFEELVSIFVPATYDEPQARFADAKVYFDKTRGEKIAATRRDIQDALEAKQNKLKNDAEITKSSREMIHSLRAAMRAAGGFDRERTYSYESSL